MEDEIMNLKDYVVLMLVFSLVMTSLGMFFSDISESYGVQIENYAVTSYVSEIKNMAYDMAESIKSARISDIELLNMPVVTLVTFYETSKLIFTTLMGMYEIFVSEISGILRIPEELTSIIIAIIIVNVVFAMIKLFLNREV